MLSLFSIFTVKTWQNEHFEYHGQCDLVLTKDQEFADGLGLDVQIRTKLIRFWSYIKQAAIRIGDDILEVEGSADPEADASYWINLEYQGPLETVGGFPVKFHKRSAAKSFYEIDLSSKFPGQKIVISTYRYKEFARADFENQLKKPLESPRACWAISALEQLLFGTGTVSVFLMTIPNLEMDGKCSLLTTCCSTILLSPNSQEMY